MNSSLKRVDYLEGKFLEENKSLYLPNSKVLFIGNEASIGLDEELLSKHILFIGGIGTGKTNAMLQSIEQIQKNMNKNDVMIIFDTKGDFYNQFYRKGIDAVISNDDKATGVCNIDYWNLMKEAMVDGDAHLEENLLEICTTLFQEKISKSQNPFFPLAAKDVFYGILTYLIRRGKAMHNKELNLFLNQASIKQVIERLELHKDLKSIVNYISNPESPQTQGVYSELQQVRRELLVGNFRKEGGLSIRDFVRNKGGRTLFIEYDLGIGKVLTPIYRLMIDLAIKESLSRNKSEGNVYYIIDEFMLLPNLYHIENGLNFGRSLGAKFIVAMQNVEQIRSSYGYEIANSILSGFNTNVSFRVNDYATREFVKSIYGQNRKKIAYNSLVSTQPIREEVILSNVVEDWDISSLGVGEAIISIGKMQPTKFKFEKY
ncbi:type IV secretory system conjugative DNA transfer family protein [Clostridium grantii]|uniref:Type IV secretion-system coupling protein DNA-binding domain-containing protein n=1 Tax=Clostridium grantii DSM 8605 TaxID=1121316 RepID=A0A1M5WWL0_9CLOT|nr:type IV secretion system DNA-binding domain-containing protein [Clostridium grantii]SHH91850.1 Type IV secretion-system coupling protein DNA-binding domain-containing protein [Clostridium grantii DSM 8605]